MISKPRAKALLLHMFAAVLLMVGVTTVARGQGSSTPTPVATRNPEATRAELEGQLAADRRDASGGSDASRAQRTAEIATIQDRLTNGDFAVGDRIVLSVAGQPALTDTFTVREGQILRLPTLSDVSLHGVLRSELQAHLYVEISRFLRDPVVRSGSLVRLSILGSVVRPGFYALPADMLVSNAIMTTGGLANNANVNRTVIKRGGQIIWTRDAVSSAIRNGSTIDQLNLRAGDEIDVGEKGGSFLTVGLPIIGAVVGVVTVVVLLTNH
jgi:protein involved in polysaccharide export with SLBB domain